MKKALSFIAITSLLPTVAFGAVDDLKTLIDVLIAGINSLVPLLFGLALIAFMWSIIKYLYAADPKKLAEARNYIVFSIIAIAVMMSVWTLSKLARDIFFEGTNTPLDRSL